MKDRIEELIGQLERELHIEFPASRRDSAKFIISRWILAQKIEGSVVAVEEIIPAETSVPKKSKGKPDAAGQ